VSRSLSMPQNPQKACKFSPTLFRYHLLLLKTIFVSNLCQSFDVPQINIDPESLKPKLPSKKDLRPYPKTCYLEFKGHTSPVTSISVETTGQWLASGMC
jgi:hypothetical protein